MKIHRYVTTSRAEGPGNRFVIWTQGCPIHCPGCFNRALQDEDGGTSIDEASMIRLLDEAICSQETSDPLTGLTLLGGEPFFQAAPLARVAAFAQEKGLNVITFTGYTYEYLQGPEAPRDAHALLQVTDVLIDGPFKEDESSLERPLVGSANQRFLFLTNRLSMQDFQPNQYEIKIEKDGSIRINGMGHMNQLMRLVKE
ncbi:MAG: radical SAM protein [Firmicutes bacterium]|nr:radical SAM protein [Bacillota bacterium]